MRMKYLLAASLVLALSAGGLAAAAEPPALTEADNGKTVNLTVGQAAELTLTMAGGTGYIWQLAEVDKKVLEVGEKRTQVDNPMLMGGPVKLIWPLKAVGSGEVTLEAKLVRPWIPDQPAKKITIRLKVK